MRFFDEITIYVQSGAGGNGIVTGRRETGIPYGGPSGGNGGKWWSIILKASKDENTLVAYRYKSRFKAKPGEPGRSKDQYGANADDITLVVPVGTLVRDKKTWTLLHAFTTDGEEWTVVSGGEGGVGNMHFKDSINQYPNFALLGEPGQEKEIVLELQLLADVALIGSPSVGKSSLINSISNTKAKVADYPFTTLVPNLGSVIYEDKHFNVIDIPGLIKGAAEGKGLGNAFLRHILKSRIFCIVLDIDRYDTGLSEAADLLTELMQYIKHKCDPEAEEEIQVDIKAEEGMLTLYAYYEDRVVLEKRLVFLVNKYDLVNDQEILKEYTTQLTTQLLAFFKKNKIWKGITSKLLLAETFAVSAASHYGLHDWLKHIVHLLDKTAVQEVYHLENMPMAEVEEEKFAMIEEITEAEKPHLLEGGFIDPGEYDYAKVRQIRNPDICKLVWMTRWGNHEGENHFWKMMQQEGFLQGFETAGIMKGDILKIISYYEGKEDRYIVY